MKFRSLFQAGVLCFLSSHVLATELVYTPVNPSFGGSPLNGNYLLQKAQAQNDHEDPLQEKSFVEKFQESLERNLINSLTRKIADGEVKDGVYDTGEFRVEVSTEADGTIVVMITRLSTGELTVIRMPAVPGKKP
jgi:curli production assembly/transport component CsgF